MEAMLKFARPLAAAIGLIALAGVIPANAADVVMEVPPAPAAPMVEPPLNTWSGPYAGVTLGFGFSGRVKNNDANNTINTEGFMGGGFAGYNFQMDNFVAGVEGDVGYGGLKGDNTDTEVKGGVNGSLRARLGYAISPDVLPYVTAGGAAQSVKLTTATESEKKTMVGWTAGVGTDVKLTDQVFGRVEYRYTDYGSKTFNSGDIRARDHRVQSGIGMKF